MNKNKRSFLAAVKHPQQHADNRVGHYLNSNKSSSDSDFLISVPVPIGSWILIKKRYRNEELKF